MRTEVAHESHQSPLLLASRFALCPQSLLLAGLLLAATLTAHAQASLSPDYIMRAGIENVRDEIDSSTGVRSHKLC